MTEDLLSLLIQWGLPVLAMSITLSCLALPIPTSLVMLVCGSFVAAGEFDFALTWITALGAAVLGDQIGFGFGRVLGVPLIAGISKHKTRRNLINKATEQLEQSGNWAVFLSRWLFSPLGPYINFICGATVFSWRRFTFWSVMGETVWVSVYITLGYVFGQSMDALAEISADLSGIFAAMAVLAVLIWIARHLVHRHHPHIQLDQG